jgi:hypothetical protein
VPIKAKRQKQKNQAIKLKKKKDDSFLNDARIDKVI